MTNQINDEIADRIADEVSKIPFVRAEDAVSYSVKWFNAVLESEQSDIFKVQPQLFYPKAMTDDELIRAENSFINSFSE